MIREELIQALEKATGPNLELESEIYVSVVCDNEVRKFVSRIRSEFGDSVTQALARLGITAPAYTGSLDAAMKLAGGLRYLSLSRRTSPDMGGRDWLVSASGIRVAARSWPLGLCILFLKSQEDPSNAK